MSPACSGAASTRTAAALGLTRAQCRTLGYLARNEGINQAGLADILEIRPMTLVRQIDRMEEAGWIERRPDPADRRARRLFLTDKARPVLGRIWNVANETRDEALRAPVRSGGRAADRAVAAGPRQPVGARAAARRREPRTRAAMARPRAARAASAARRRRVGGRAE